MDKDVQINSVIGYSGTKKLSLGSTRDGLILHPDNEHLIHPLGSTIIVRHVLTREQTFLRGHDNKVSVIRVSPDGKYVASGQKTFMGFQADVIIWDFQQRSLKHRLKLHKVLISSLSFSFDSRLLASQGGLEDKYALQIMQKHADSLGRGVRQESVWYTYQGCCA
jgi:WD40 repeat protein